MCPVDDIPSETPSSQTERDSRREEGTSRRSVGPESEDRGGPEVVDETLDNDSDRFSEKRPRVKGRPSC